MTVSRPLVLFLLAPFCGQYLLGNIPLDSTGLLAAAPLAMLYGGGAVLIREITRRTGRGWGTVTLLAVAYAVVEEGLVTQSLFNPGYVGEDLHGYGPLPALRMGGPWTLLVLTIHVVWSILLPIALAELLFPDRADRPWLGRPGIAVAAVLFLLSALLIGATTALSEGFLASLPQLIGAALAAVVAVVAAFLLRPAPRTGGPVPGPVTVGVAALLAAAAFLAVQELGLTQRILPVPVAVALDVALLAGTAVALGTWSRRTGWTVSHRFALVVAAVLAYGVWGMIVQAQRYGPDPASLAVQAGIAVVALGLVVVARPQAVRTATQP